MSKNMIPQTVWPHWGVLTAGVKAQCSIEVVSVPFGIFPDTKWLLWNVDVHFDCAGSHKTGVAVLAFGVFPVNFHAKWLLWHVHVHFDCEGLQKTLAPGDAPGIFPVNFHTKMALVRSPVQPSRHFGPARSLSLWRCAHFEMPRATFSSLWACHVALVVACCSFGWSRRSCAEILTRRSLIQSLPRDLVQRALIEILYRDVQRS